jgi:hypothetical protein
MKKIISFFFLSYLASIPLQAQTDPQTAQFLRKLNLYYYCPSREGLKGFSCVLTLSVSEIYKQSLENLGNSKNLMDALDGQKFNLTITTDGKRVFTPIEPLPSGDLNFDSQLKKQLNDIVNDFNPVFDTWTADVFKPGFDEATLTHQICTLKKIEGGFVVDQKANDGSDLEMFFDTKGKQGRALGISNNGTTLLEMFFGYSSGPRGYQLDFYQGIMKKMILYEAEHLTYEPVGKYILPKTITKEIMFGNMFEKGSALTIDFSNYQLIE